MKIVLFLFFIIGFVLFIKKYKIKREGFKGNRRFKRRVSGAPEPCVLYIYERDRRPHSQTLDQQETIQ